MEYIRIDYTGFNFWNEFGRTIWRYIFFVQTVTNYYSLDMDIERFIRFFFATKNLWNFKAKTIIIETARKNCGKKWVIWITQVKIFFVISKTCSNVVSFYDTHGTYSVLENIYDTRRLCFLCWIIDSHIHFLKTVRFLTENFPRGTVHSSYHSLDFSLTDELRPTTRMHWNYKVMKKIPHEFERPIFLSILIHCNHCLKLVLTIFIIDARDKIFKHKLLNSVLL